MVEILQLLRKIYSFLGISHKKEFIYVIFLNLLLGLLDVITIASTIPVLSLFSGDENLVTLNLQSLSIFKSNDPQFYWVVFVTSVAFIYLIATLFRLFTIFRINRFIESVRDDLSVRILGKYLNKSYSEILSEDTSEIAKIILSEVDQFIVYVFRPTALLISGVLIFFLILTFLIYSSPFGTLISVSCILIFYICFFTLVKKPLTNFGNISSSANELRFRYATEAFRSFKDIKIYNSEKFFTERIKSPSILFSKALSGYQTLEIAPKYILEFIAFSGLMFVTIFLIIVTDSNNSSYGQLPIIGTFAFAAYKCQPILSSIFHGFGSLKFGKKIIKNIDKQLNLKITRTIETKNIQYHSKLAIHLDKVSYSYCKDGKNIQVLKDISLKFNNVGIILICGPSGIGKSTFLDLIFGLIKPKEGKINYFTKDKNLSKKINITYLHQDFNLYNSDVIANVAFGESKKDIDLARVTKALEDVQMLSFINTLPDKMQTILGENGKNLSGGQKQRIALARAIYSNPDILILDEPTSSLDNKLEEQIFRIIKNISEDKLVIMSTHKLSKIFENEVFLKIQDLADIKFTTYKEIK